MQSRFKNLQHDVIGENAYTCCRCVLMAFLFLSLLYRRKKNISVLYGKQFIKVGPVEYAM